jgi:hypothetical protein
MSECVKLCVWRAKVSVCVLWSKLCTAAMPHPTTATSASSLTMKCNQRQPPPLSHLKMRQSRSVIFDSGFSLQ